MGYKNKLVILVCIMSSNFLMAQNNVSVLVDSLLNIGYQCRINGNNYCAEHNYSTALRLSQIELGDDDKLTAKCLLHVSELGGVKGNLDALSALAMNKKIMEDMVKEAPHLKQQYEDLYLTQLKYHTENTEYFNKVRNNLPLHKAISDELTASLMIQQGRKDDAISFLKKSIKDSSVSAWTYMLYCEADSSNSKQILNDGIIRLKNGDSPIEYYRLLVYKLSFESQFSKEELLETSIEAIMVLDEVSKTYLTEAEKIELRTTEKELYDFAISTAFDLNDYKLSFNLVEHSKLNALKEITRELYLKNVAGIPVSVLSEELDVNNELSNIEYAINTEPDSVVKKLLYRQIELEQQKRKIVQYLESNYPMYYALKYYSKFIPDTLLNSSKSIISYYIDDRENLYTFLVQNGNVIAFRSTHENLEKTLKDYLGSIKKFKKDQFNETSYALYKVLIEPIFKKVKSESVVIIPHKELYLIPFAPLLSKPFNELNYSKAHFLIKQWDISYSYSYELKNKRTVNATRNIAFAPFSSDNLPHSGTEVDYMSKVMGDTKSYKDSSATLPMVYYLSGDYNMLHFATHSVYHKEDYRYNRIEFSDKSLYVNQLYFLNINVNTVFLSSCKSGVGELDNVEGVLSLPRPFFYLGASNVIFSLWNINDKSTLELVKGYYPSMDINEAKRKLIKDDALSYPYFWSGIVNYLKFR